jgi:2-(3-amino-3-carboxypropyl)histidine synthase
MRADEQNAVELSTNLDGGGHENNGKHAKVKESAKIMLQNTLPESITGDLELNTAIRTRLPAHYNFEVQKTLHMIRQHSVRRVALQLPEGLQMFATTLCELLEQHAYKNDPSRRRLRTVIQADVTYGACCIDDYTALALGCDLLVHYGHSCLVPITTTQIRTLYVFVDIQFQLPHLIDSLRLNFPPKTTRKIAMVATIQFSSSLQQIKRLMLEECGYEQVDIPQIRPLSPGEILGCTSPRLPNDIDLCLYVRASYEFANIT